MIPHQKEPLKFPVHGKGGNNVSTKSSDLLLIKLTGNLRVYIRIRLESIVGVLHPSYATPTFLLS